MDTLVEVGVETLDDVDTDDDVDTELEVDTLKRKAIFITKTSRKNIVYIPKGFI